ncbi:MAG: hypothetical protein ABEJ96_07265, partial [Thiohalorhabdaceae bacterium]
GELAAVTNPLGRTTQFQYDAAGRLTAEQRPDGATTRYTYDADGNLTSVQPPGESAHVFRYAEDGQRTRYQPPDLSGVSTVTRYRYNPDRQPTRITRPDGTEVRIGYNDAGKRSQVRIPAGTYDYAYDGDTGQLATLTAPGGQSLDLGYNGFLPTQSQWSGPISGTVRRSYDDNFWVTGRSVNGNRIGLNHDADGLLTRSGELRLTRDPDHGAVTGTRLGQVGTARTHNGFGELASRSVANA